MKDKDLCDLSATELRQLIGSQQLDPVDLLQSCIDRINRYNPMTNAVVTTCFDEAMAEAEAASKKIKRGEPLLPLEGLPVLIKDLSETKGLRTTYGSRHFADNVTDYDAIVVARLRAAGAIVLGKTNTPEFGAGANTKNTLFGATHNPFKLSATCGGSSGGSAVALACGMSVLATGSDLGGSLRIPASFCSIVGMRPSPGLVPSASHVLGHSPLWTDGPMARTVEDVALCLEVISGFDSKDPISLPRPSNLNLTRDEQVDLSKLRTGFSTDLGVAKVESGIEGTFERCKAQLKQYFHSGAECAIDLSVATEVFRILRAESLLASYGDLVEHHAEDLDENIISGVREAEGLTIKDTARAGAKHTKLYREFQKIFDEIDVLICPATAVSPFPVKKNYPEDINGIPLEEYYSWYAITWALSLVGCPVISIPCGTDHNGMPFGIQVVAARNQDAFLLQVAHALQQALEFEGSGRVQPNYEA